MRLKVTEQRKQPRVYFKPDKQLTAQVLFHQEHSAPIKINLVNICESGLCFLLSEKAHAPITEGSHLILLKIEGEALLQDINDVDMVVRWSAYMEELKYKLNGCQFVNLLPDYQIQLREFIHNLIDAKL